MTREDTYYAALCARDARFDGKFFTGVKTTGIYCRPVCPARPKRENVEFFRTRAEAVAAGYRACRRCRPEVDPRSPAWTGTSALVRRAVRAIRDQGDRIDNEDAFAVRFGVTARHLRRLFTEEIGRTPKQLADENRLTLARALIKESNLPMAHVALAAGFQSVRRFNAAFRERFGRAPGAHRRGTHRDALTLTLAYRPPFNFAALIQTYRNHRVGDLEVFTADGGVKRLIEIDGRVGWVTVHDEPARSRLAVNVDFPDVTQLPIILARVRATFDLDVDPVIVENALGVVAPIRRLLKKHPGLRVPTGWDPFEIAIATILGQLISVEAARNLVAGLIELLGRESGERRDGRPIKLFPRPIDIAESDLNGLGTTGARKHTLREFSRRVASGELSLEPTQDVAIVIEKLRAVRGIGPWTASYVAMKVLRDPDAFPETDLILARALELHPREHLERMRPWRAYAAILFWREYAQSLKKPKGVAREKLRRQ